MRRLLILIVLMFAVAACERKALSYADQIAAHRTETDRFMRESPESPVPREKRASFPPISYFPIDPAYHTAAALTPAHGGPTLDMPTSTGQLRKMRRVGTLAFTLKGQGLTLGAFVEADQSDMRRLFVPFGDLTN